MPFYLEVLPSDDDNIGQVAVSYFSNDGVSAPNTSFYDVGAIHIVRNFAQSGLTAPADLSFAGWNTLPTGGGTAFAPGDALAVPAGGVLLYAQWVAAQVTAVSIAPQPARVPQGGQLQFVPMLEATDGANLDVSWSVAGHEGVSINNGLLMVGADVPVGTQLTVTATSIHNFRVSGTATAIVQDDQTAMITGVTTFPRTAEIVRGGEHQFTAAVTAAGGASTAVEWSISGHIGATISQNGVVTVDANVPTGITLTITARSTFDGTMFSTSTATVVAEQLPSVVRVEVNPVAVTVAAGATQQFDADVVVILGASTVVNWSVSGHAGATISGTGFLAIDAGVPEGTILTVTATSAFNPSISATAQVTVGPANQPTIIAVNVTPNTTTLQQGASHTFNVNVVATNGAPTGVTWAVAGHASASINNAGVLTIGTSVPVGTTLTVTARSNFDPSVYGTATVHVAASDAQFAMNLSTQEGRVGELTTRTLTITRQGAGIAIENLSIAVQYRVTSGSVVITTIQLNAAAPSIDLMFSDNVDEIFVVLAEGMPTTFGGPAQPFATARVER
jgi:hypothetical protein